jgi:hypothetical protein
MYFSLFRSTLHILILFVMLVFKMACSEKNQSPQYTVVDSPWNPGLGNHRAIITVRNPAEVIKLDLLWRRRS